MTEDRESLPPQDLEAERAVLGAAMQSPRAYGEAAALLSQADLYRPAHREIWSTIAAIDDLEGFTTRVHAVADELERRGHLQRVGGKLYLHQLVSEAPVAGSVKYLAEQVAEKARARRVIEAATRVARMAHSGAESGNLAEALEGVQNALDAAAEGGNRDRGVADPAELAANVVELLKLPKPPSTPMGWSDLDDLTGGMEGGQLICVAARPGVGKSVMAMGTALNVTRRGGSAAFFSFEMLREELTMRCFANMGRVHLTSMRERELGEYEWRQINRAAEEFSSLALHISDKTEVTSAGIRSTCRELARSGGGLDLVVVDYLQLATVADSRVPREQQVAGISRSLKKLAMELRVPVIVVSQLNRGPEQRSDKKPQLSDLRESGSIEQDCDKVILLHHDQENEMKGAAEIEAIVPKNRQGSTGQVTLAWSPQYARIDSLSRQDEPVRGVA